MTVGREEGEEGQVPGPPGPPAAGGLVVGGTAEQGAQSDAPATAAVAPPAEQEAAAAKSPMTDQEAIDSFPTAKLNKLDELISNPRWVGKHRKCKKRLESLPLSLIYEPGN